MKDVVQLHEAFHHFTVASKSLEEHYKSLQDKVQYLTDELEKKNRQLKTALSDTEEAKDYLKGILQSLREGIIVLDPDENVTMINTAAEKMLDLDIVNVMGRPFHTLDFSIEREGNDTFLIAEDRRYNVFLSRSDVLDAEGSIRGHVILFQDITRVRELESVEERNKRLIAMGELAAKIVHEIRNPLCSIELYASMLERELDSTIHVNLARGISTGTKSLNNVLTNMLFFAKPQKPLFKLINLRRTLDESLFLLMPMIETRKMKIHENTICSMQIKGDSELLKQVFMNILLNAIQASPEKGKIDVCVKGEEEFIVVEVSDEGTGIDQENMEKIFNPFYSTKEKGTGLGLTITSKIMLAHRGKIKVESEKKKGTCFQLYFPINHEDHEEHKVSTIK